HHLFFWGPGNVPLGGVAAPGGARHTGAAAAPELARRSRRMTVRSTFPLGLAFAPFALLESLPAQEEVAGKVPEQGPGGVISHPAPGCAGSSGSASARSSPRFAASAASATAQRSLTRRRASSPCGEPAGTAGPRRDGHTRQGTAS